MAALEISMNNKQQLATFIQAAIDAGKTNNPVLVNMAVSQLNPLIEALPDNWMPKPEQQTETTA